MSRIELDAIQNKLKTAIQNHQMLVKTKGDQQNVAFKSCLKELQEEIKRLSEEQKKIVVKLRESLVKSSSQSQPVVAQQQQQQQQLLTTSVAGGGGGEMSSVLDPQTMTAAAISQSRLVYPTPQGGAILPVGMVAVPLAHVQRPTLGVTFNAGRGQICTPAGSITLQPGDYANAMVAAAAAAAQLPSGLHGANSINIPINNALNSTSTNIALQNSIAINNITNAINVSSLNGNLVNGSINIAGLNNANPSAINSLNTIIGSAGMTAHPIGSIVIGSNTFSPLNNNNNVALTTVVNSQGASNMTSAQNGSTNIPQSNALVGSGVLPNSSTNQILTLANGSNPHSVVAVSSIPTFCSAGASSVTVAPQLSTVSTLAKDKITVLSSQLPHQTVNLPQAAQQQQRLIATSANQPIKVPQYTASPTRTTYCSIAPAPGPALPTSAVARQPMASAVTLATASAPKKPEAIVRPSTSKTSTLPMPAVSNSPSVVSKGKMVVSTPKADASFQQQKNSSPAKSRTTEEDKKHQFMKALDLYAPAMLKDLLHKRNERKRRTTANPQYSIGFQSHRWQRNEILSGAFPFKKAKVGKERKPATKQSPSDNQSKADKVSDNHDDFCAACGKGGQLLMCETCRLVYHLDCLKPPLTQAPKYAWSCPKCLVSGKGSANLNSEALSRVHSYIGKRMAKDDERKKLQRKGAEIHNERAFLDNRSKKLETDMKDQHDSKRKLHDKEKASRKELDQLSVLVQSVRENHSTITPTPVSRVAAASCKLNAASSSSSSSSSSSPLVDGKQAHPSNILLSSTCDNTIPTPVSIQQEEESQCKDYNGDCVVSQKSSSRNQGDLTTVVPSSSSSSSPTVTPLIADDRIVLEFKVSAKEFNDIEHNSSSRRDTAPMETEDATDAKDNLDVDMACENGVAVENSPVSSSSSSLSSSSSSSSTTPPSITSALPSSSSLSTSSPTVMNSCGESLKQAAVVKADQQQLPISS